MENIKKKNILYCDENGNFSAHSMEEILVSRTNSWKGWRCSAGMANLHITADGNIYAGTCRVGGLLGNVYDHGVQFPNQWITCTKEWCMCGAEMELFKFKQVGEKKYQLSELKNYSEERVTPQWVGSSNVNRSKNVPLSITWDLGRRCNYKCSYCPPSTANTFEVHKTLGSLRYAAETIFKGFCKELKAQWIFTGGEPTLNPAYLDLLNIILSEGHLVHTQSNGSRDSEYYCNLIEKSSIGLSVHLEEYNRSRFLAVCSAIAAKKSTIEPDRKKHFSIRIMVAPGKSDEALSLKEDLKSLDNFSEINVVNFGPLYQKYEGDQLMNYTKDELDTILQNV